MKGPRPGTVRYSTELEGWVAIDDDRELFETSEEARQHLAKKHNVDPREILVIRRQPGTGTAYFHPKKKGWFARWKDTKGVFHERRIPKGEEATHAFLDAIFKEGEMYKGPRTGELTPPLGNAEVVKPDAIVVEHVPLPPADNSIAQLKASRSLLVNSLHEKYRTLMRLRKAIADEENALTEVDMELNELFNTHLKEGVRIEVEMR